MTRLCAVLAIYEGEAAVHHCSLCLKSNSGERNLIEKVNEVFGAACDVAKKRLIRPEVQSQRQRVMCPPEQLELLRQKAEWLVKAASNYHLGTMTGRKATRH